MSRAEDAARERIAAIYGPEAEAELGQFRGVLHVVAAALDPDDARGEWATIRIGPTSPASEADRFALALARARADAIVVTGQILRDEPQLAYAAPGFGLTAWRAATLGRGPDRPPQLLILTRGETPLAADHPALRGWARARVLTARDRAASVARQLPAGVPVVGLDEPSLATAIAWAQADGCAVVSIEAGPSTTAPYHRQEPMPIDELMLSEFLGPLPASLRGPSFAERARVEAQLERRSSRTIMEPSGPWRLSRWCRRGAAR